MKRLLIIFCGSLVAVVQLGVLVWVGVAGPGYAELLRGVWAAREFREVVEVGNDGGLDDVVSQEVQYDLMIPVIGLSADVGEVDGLDGVEYGLLDGVVRDPRSASPGYDGVGVLYGHSSALGVFGNMIFAGLANLEVGDEMIWGGDVYVVSVVDIVEPGDGEVLRGVPGQKEIRLVTCWPIGTSLKRLVVSGVSS